MRVALVALLVVAACGGRARSTSRGASAPPPVAARAADWMVPLLPEGVQIVVEVDLARLRDNPIVGEVAGRVLAELGAAQRLPGLPMHVMGSPLAAADALVLGAYGVGTAQAATIIVLATRGDVPSGTRAAQDLVVLGPAEWVDQVAARAAIAGLAPDAPAPTGAPLTLVASPPIAELRDHAMPPKAPGAILRVTARLPFDARVALARTTGLEAAPGRLSIWADVVDDAALIIDADAADPGEKDPKAARTRLATALRALLSAIAREPTVRALGVASSLAGAKFVEQGTWVRAIIAIGPRQLQRTVQRASGLLWAEPAAAAEPEPAP